MRLCAIFPFSRSGENKSIVSSSLGKLAKKYRQCFGTGFTESRSGSGYFDESEFRIKAAAESGSRQIFFMKKNYGTIGNYF